MSERSVAEIIGWQRELNHWQHPNGSWHMSPTVTPDDMLAWLHVTRLADFGCDASFDGDGVEWWVTADNGDHFDTAPTLHAALEAAVRSVAGDAP